MQKHRHSTTCRRHGSCRFHYPHPPSPLTVIACESHGAHLPEEKLKDIHLSLQAVRKSLDDKDTPENITLDKLLERGDVSLSTYIEGLKICSRSNSVVMKRSPSVCLINMYNPSIFCAWKANMDIQYILHHVHCLLHAQK